MGLQFSFPEQTGPVAINTVGTLTVNDGVVTGFNATSNYLQCSQKIDFTQSDYEIAVRVKPTSFSTTTFLFSQGGLTLALGSGSDAGKVELYISLETSGYSEYKQLYTTTLNNIWSLIFKRTIGTKYEVFVATDTGERTLIKTLNTSENIRPGDASNILRWGGGNTVSQYLQGSLYLQGTYATVNGQLWAGKYYQTPEPLGVVIDDGTNQTSANYLILNDKLVWANPNIYLQSTGTQYIQIPYTPVRYDEISTKFLITNTTSTNQTIFFCGQDDPRYTVILSGDLREAYYKYFTSGNVVGTNYNLSTNKWFSLTTNSAGTLTINNVSHSEAYSGPIGGADKDLYLFTNQSKTSYMQGRMKQFTIKNSGVEKLNFVPVPSGMTIGSYTTPSAGMFDLVNQQFYANAGSGTFTWGKDN